MESKQSLNITSVLSRAFQTWFDHFAGFFILALILTLPLLPLELAPQLMSSGPEGGAGAIAVIGGFLRSIAGYLLTGVVVFTVFRSLNGQTGSLVDSVSAVKSRLLTIVLTAIVISLAVALGLLACVIPGIILALVFTVAVPVVVVEEQGVIDSLTRSKDLTKGNRIQIFGIYVLYFILLIVIGLAVMFVVAFVGGCFMGFSGSEDADQQAFGSAMIIVSAFIDYGGDALLMPLQATLTTIIYHDLRQNHEQIATSEMFPDLHEAQGVDTDDGFDADDSSPEQPVW